MPKFYSKNLLQFHYTKYMATVRSGIYYKSCKELHRDQKNGILPRFNIEWNLIDTVEDNVSPTVVSLQHYWKWLPEIGLHPKCFKQSYSHRMEVSHSPLCILQNSAFGFPAVVLATMWRSIRKRRNYQNSMSSLLVNILFYQ